MIRKSRRKNIPWIDKYRPNKLEGIVYQEEVIKMLKRTLETGDLPHLIFYGPPGTGKTSTILAIAKELFGPRQYKNRVIELNASDERGINVVRTRIISFAKLAISTKDDNYPCPPYKIIILDEADAMTTEAQSALRKTMENNSNITRFCFICNYINQIIDPITSRCVKFRFKSLNDESVINKLEFITNRENIVAEKRILNKIAKASLGDLRKAIMFLQNLKYVYDCGGNENDINNMLGIIPKNILEEIEQKCIINKSNLMEIYKMGQNIKLNGYPIHTIIEEIFNLVIKCNKISDIKKSKISLHMSEIERRLTEGSDEFIQLIELLSIIYKIS